MTTSGECIAYFRKMRKVSQDTLAKHLGLKRPILSNIEQGHADPTTTQIRKIADLLDIGPYEIDKRINPAEWGEDIRNEPAKESR